MTGRLYSIDQERISIGGATVFLSDETFILNVEPEPAACEECLDKQISSLERYLGRRPKKDPNRPFLG